VTNVWAFDLNIEFHETIKQRCFPVETRSTKSVADLSSLPDGRPAILVRVILAILPVGSRSGQRRSASPIAFAQDRRSPERLSLTMAQTAPMPAHTVRAMPTEKVQKEKRTSCLAFLRRAMLWQRELTHHSEGTTET
jgi:hypothetical protein